MHYNECMKTAVYKRNSKCQNLLLRPADLPDIAELTNLLIMLFSQEAEFKPNTRRQQRGLRMILRNPSIGQIFVAEKAGRVIGMASLLFTISTALGGKVGILEDVVVIPEFRGQGIGKQLIHHILKYSRRMKLKRLTLLTDGDNHIAQDLYKHFGFRCSKMLPMRLSLSE